MENRPYSGRYASADINDVDTPVGGDKWSEDTIVKNLPNNFIPREYQQNAWNHIVKEHLEHARRKSDALNRGEDFLEPEPSWSKKAIQVLHRRAGKDIGALHLIALCSQLRVGNYKHILPFKTQARDAIWDGIDALGNRFINTAFPAEIVESINESRMLVRFTNGSTYQLQGGDSDKLVGAGPVGIVYSESALMSPNVRTFLRPMLDETGGWELHITTPRGKNWFYKLFKHAEESEEWYCDYLTILDTWRYAYFAEPLKGVDVDTIHESLEGEIKFRKVADAEKAISSGKIKAMYKVRIMTEKQVQALKDEGQDPFIVDQEYYCDWDVALAGSYLGDMVGKLLKRGGYGNFPHNPNRPVYVHMDIGFNDYTSITFTQEGPAGQPIIIHHIYGTNRSLLDWCYDIENIANERGYKIALILMPHDADNTEVSSGMTRREYVLEEGQFDKRGLSIEVLETAPKQAGIDKMRAILATACISDTCEFLLESLKAYRRKFDEKNQTYLNTEVHDWACHGADNFRYLSSSWETCLSYVSIEADRSRGNAKRNRIKVKRARQ